MFEQSADCHTTDLTTSLADADEDAGDRIQNWGPFQYPDPDYAEILMTRMSEGMVSHNDRSAILPT